MVDLLGPGLVLMMRIFVYGYKAETLVLLIYDEEVRERMLNFEL